MHYPSLLSARNLGSRIHYGYVIILMGTLTMLGTQGFTRFGYNMLLPGMREALGFNFTEMGLLATANYVGYAATNSVVGWVVVRWGFRRTIAIATGVVGTAMFLTGAAPSYGTALALQVIAGIGVAMAITPAMSLPGAWFASHRRGMATGVTSAGGPLGSLVTGLLIPTLVISFGAMGWRYGWFALGALALAFGVLNLALLRNHPNEMGLEPVGAVPGSKQSPRQERLNWRVVYRSPLVWHLSLLSLISTLSAISFNTFFTAYVIKEHAMDASVAGQLWALQGIAGVASGFIWGSISDRIGRRYALMGTFATQAICFALFAAGGGLVVFALCAIMYGVTARAAFTVVASYTGDVMEPRLAAAALGASSMFAGVGQALGPTIAGFIADSTSSFTLAFWGSAALILLGAFGAALLSKKPLPRHSYEAG